jgi:hypothetical protein
MNKHHNVKCVMKKAVLLLAAATTLAAPVPANAHVYFGTGPWGLGIGLAPLGPLGLGAHVYCYYDEYSRFGDYDGRRVVRLRQNLPLGSVVIHLPDGSIVIRKRRNC